MKIKNQSLDYFLDFIGIIASLFCAIHCVALYFLLTISTLGSFLWLNSVQLERSFIAFSIAIAAGSLLWSYFQKHRKPQALWLSVLGISLILSSHIGYGISNHWLTAFGGILLAAAHTLNWLFIQNKFQYANSNRLLWLLSLIVALLLTYELTQSKESSIESRRELLELVWEKQ
ncbi:MAG: MerC domain-containing protein [Bacteroidota bacterium]